MKAETLGVEAFIQEKEMQRSFEKSDETACALRGFIVTLQHK